MYRWQCAIIRVVCVYDLLASSRINFMWIEQRNTQIVILSFDSSNRIHNIWASNVLVVVALLLTVAQDGLDGPFGRSRTKKIILVFMGWCLINTHTSNRCGKSNFHSLRHECNNSWVGLCLWALALTGTLNDSEFMFACLQAWNNRLSVIFIQWQNTHYAEPYDECVCIVTFLSTIEQCLTRFKCV